MKIIKKIFPLKLFIYIKKFRKRFTWKKYSHLSTKEVFNKIYSENTWGKNDNNPHAYFSGGGSHEVELIQPYIDAVKKFLLRFKEKPDVIDLGCGDFNIGSKIRSSCKKYIACDIVDFVIEQNRIYYKDLNVDFRVFDLTSEKCEKVDVIFLRQVLQHLSNEEISRGLKNTLPQCKYLVLTEHLPSTYNFKRNIDKPTGPDVRAELNSGVDITKPPFNYNLESECICEVPDQLGTIKTIVYRCN